MHKTLLLLALTVQVGFAEPALVFMAEQEGSKQVMTCRADGRGVRAVTQGPAWHLYPDISADGQTLVWVEGPDDSHLGVKLKNSAGERWLTQPDGRNLHPRLAGTGRLLAFSQGGQLATLDPTLPSPPVSVLKSEHEAWFPSPSSDGSFLVYQGNVGPDKALYLRELPDGAPQRLTPEGQVCMAPSLSPDDRQVAFASVRDGNWDVYVLDLGTREIQRKTTGAWRDLAPTFRPDGSLVYCSERNGRLALYSQTDGVDRFLAGGPGTCYSPQCSGDLNLQQAQRAPIPGPPRSSFGAASEGPKVLIVGGHQGHEHSYPPESFVARVDRFDDSQWSAGTPRPVAAHGFSVVADGRYLYAFGGFAHSPQHKPGWHSLDRIDRYDRETDTWEQVGTLPRPRSSNVAARVGDKVYLIGGWDSTPQSPGDVNGRFHGEVDVFDLRTHRCETASWRLPDPLRRAFSAAVVGDRIVLAGGIGEGGQHFSLLDRVTSLDPRTGATEEWPALPFATFAPALGTSRGELLVMGGMFRVADMDYRYVPHIFRLAPGARRWTHTGRFLSESKGFSQVVGLPDGGLGILGGHTYQADGSDTPVPTFETLNLLGEPQP